MPENELSPTGEGDKTPAPSPPTNEEVKTESPKTEPKAEAKAELDPALIELMKESGAQAKAVSDLVKANSQLAAKVEAANSQIAQLKQGLLSKAEMEQWKAYKALGKPDGLQEALTKSAQLEQELTQLKRTSVLREAADLLQWDSSVLLDILPLEIALTIQTEKSQPVAVVTLPDGVSQTLKEYVEKVKPKHLPSLTLTPKPTVPRMDEGSKGVSALGAVAQEFLANMNKAKVKS